MTENTILLAFRRVSICSERMRGRGDGQRGEGICERPNQQRADADRDEAEDECVKRSEQPVCAETEADATERGGEVEACRDETRQSQSRTLCQSFPRTYRQGSARPLWC